MAQIALPANGRIILNDFEHFEDKSRPWLLGNVRTSKEVFQPQVQDAGFSLIEEIKTIGLQENYFLKFRKN